jgi:hypothetical protein
MFIQSLNSQYITLAPITTNQLTIGRKTLFIYLFIYLFGHKKKVFSIQNSKFEGLMTFKKIGK